MITKPVHNNQVSGSNLSTAFDPTAKGAFLVRPRVLHMRRLSKFQSRVNKIKDHQFSSTQWLYFEILPGASCFVDMDFGCIFEFVTSVS